MVYTTLRYGVQCVINSVMSKRHRDQQEPVGYASRSDSILHNSR